MSSQSKRALLATLVADATLITGYVISALVPDRRLWPIGDSRWRWWVNWSALSVVFAGFPVLAYRDWNSSSVTNTSLRIAGALVSALGMAFSLSALFELGWMESSGREGELRTDGIYEYTRNPQSVGFVTFIVGTLLAVNSRKLALHGLLTIVIYLLFPFAEEPWLREHYGDAYEAYCKQTPRFLSRTSISRLLRE
ncbi:isoprenylcysteine carboxylmethyltransferase family protein (plasmid) [Halarchaeum sp. CBA1220]|uniref:methyltransferase family protein n=1 Tax=Halarchaeum sp. CBA1220 TaxID=1853682 RepID=UPI000F3A8D14|nr:isoprenylcysteine carboxylmethyltransferase family protein [Halarchaeum sp. CBA1220]QLC35664.1 isoprenylcysteine carboxylmethyltransferase family protein [Halarchaeum sp. CBA1220]